MDTYFILTLGLIKILLEQCHREAEHSLLTQASPISVENKVNAECTERGFHNYFMQGEKKRVKRYQELVSSISQIGV